MDGELKQKLIKIINDEFQKKQINEKFSNQEFNKFFAIFLTMGLCPQPNLKYYWKKNDFIYGNKLIKILLSRNRFSQIHSSWRFSNSVTIDEILDLIQSKFQKEWEIGSHVTLDETIIKFFGRIFFSVKIPRKPISTGIKVWTLCDNTTYVYSWSLYKGIYEEVYKLVLRMAKTLPIQNKKNFFFHIFGDSYFGSDKITEDLHKLKVNFSFLCKSDRPSYLFKKGLNPILEKGKWKTLINDKNNPKYCVTSFKDINKRGFTCVNMITTNFDDSTKEIERRNFKDRNPNNRKKLFWSTNHKILLSMGIIWGLLIKPINLLIKTFLNINICLGKDVFYISFLKY
ncbi:piggybac transposable element-derived protein [Anaeramoeba flamelloides]|uniref:Piggybac transposable element-derived protein n=1 Tax=Anaeramoeba flamelloides TaxID=1746091 RepID=A0ABQ8XTJ8_9EUKA|nr:piggybac transposable element-derived protein [Anaeramoeba flamelloides]